MSWLTDRELQQAIETYNNQNCRKAFRGVFPKDTLPKHTGPLPAFYIINTDTHNLPGRHWKALFINEKHQGEVFDSLALPISNKVIQFMNQHTTKWQTNSKAYQDLLSTQCGAFVLYYITQRLRYDSFKDVCSTFSHNVRDNELMIRNFYYALK